MKLNQLKKTKITVHGKRVNQSSNPQLLIKTTYNQFTLNDKARDLLGVRVKEGVDDMLSRVVLWDPNGTVDEATGVRFFIFRGFRDNDKELVGAKLGTTYGFTYSPVWGAWQASNPNLEGPQEVTEISIDDMRRAGMFVNDDKKIAAFKGAANIVPLYVDADGEVTLEETDEPLIIDSFGEEEEGLFDEKGNPIEVQVYGLIDTRWTEHSIDDEE